MASGSIHECPGVACFRGFHPHAWLTRRSWTPRRSALLQYELQYKWGCRDVCLSDQCDAAALRDFDSYSGTRAALAGYGQQPPSPLVASGAGDMRHSIRLFDAGINAKATTASGVSAEPSSHERCQASLSDCVRAASSSRSLRSTSPCAALKPASATHVAQPDQILAASARAPDFARAIAMHWHDSSEPRSMFNR